MLMGIYMIKNIFSVKILCVDFMRTLNLHIVRLVVYTFRFCARDQNFSVFFLACAKIEPVTPILLLLPLVLRLPSHHLNQQHPSC